MSKKLLLFIFSLLFILTLVAERGGVNAQYDQYGRYLTPPPAEEPEEEFQQEEQTNNNYNEEIEELEEKIKQQEESLKKLREEAQKQEQNLEKTEEHAENLEDYIAYFNNEIYKLEGRISITKEQILSTQLAIQKVELEINKKENDIDRVKEQMTALVQEIYKTDQESILELVFKYENFSTFFDQVQARQSLQISMDDNLKHLKALKAQLLKSKEELDEEKEQLEYDAKILRDQRIILEQKKISQRQLLAQTQQEATGYKQTLNEIRRKEQEMRQEIFDLEDQLRQALDPSNVPEARKGILQWPTEGILTQGYGCLHNSWARSSYPSCDGGAGGFHNGVDVAAGLGTPIRSADEGVVKAMESSPYAYGYWLAVEHPNGLVTTYTHMSSLRPVAVGQEVKRGQVVGYMDSTGFSTGPHLHFMVYAPGTFKTKPSSIAGILPIGATLNPFDYLQ
ncbi:MAG: peptidoglycan DD-metalloendopeptidase family protein [Candidatus Spechtbacterales bacterium]|nr:peptidoglycan DD-metalloendopeptidase family protein [Candidatus Spechtbacterales bacterium]